MENLNELWKLITDSGIVPVIIIPTVLGFLVGKLKR